MKHILTTVAAIAITSSMASAGGHANYTIGVSNTVQGNGWREQKV